MKGTLAVFDRIGTVGVAAFLRDGRLEDLLIDPPDGRIRPGAIYRARAGRLLKGLGGAIMDTPDGPVFLRNAKGIGQNQSRLVQAVSFAEPGKAAPVTSRLVLKSRYCLATPGAPGLNLSRDIRDEDRRVELRDLLTGLATDGIGLVVRSAAGQADDEAVESDVTATMDLARRLADEPSEGPPEMLLEGPDAATLGWRDWPAPDASDADASSFARHGVPDLIDGLLSPHVTLAGGAGMFVEPTRALVAVDVNTGGDTSPAAGLKANLDAAAHLPAALRLRGLGGQITLDFAPMPKKDRRQVETALGRAFRRDTIETALVGWTPLGHFELQRKRERLPLTESLPKALR